MYVKTQYPSYVSLICPVYNSHQVFKSQIKYLSKELKGLDNYVEVIFVDDGSAPPLQKIFEERRVIFDNFKLLETGVKIAWNQLQAANLGAKKARGEYLFFFDIDHIIPRGAIEELLNFKGDMLFWKRIHGVLENGELILDEETILQYGAKEVRTIPFGTGNIFAMKKDIFHLLGGYQEKNNGHYNHASGDLRKEFRKRGYKGIESTRNYLYCFPNPRVQTKLFHNLSREENLNCKKI